jgi:glycine dehydrogenase
MCVGSPKPHNTPLTPADIAAALGRGGVSGAAGFVAGIVPASIARRRPIDIPAAIPEAAALEELRGIAARNKILKSFIGQGYHGTHTPGVILRNILENPAWYTAYTPYQAEISQGRMEALVNFQTMVCELSGMPIANASLLDEATAAAEAMTLARRCAASKSPVFLVDARLHPQSIEVVQTRAAALGIEVVVGDVTTIVDSHEAFFGALVQYPATDGSIADFRGRVRGDLRAHVARGGRCCQLHGLGCEQRQERSWAGQTQRWPAPLPTCT